MNLKCRNFINSVITMPPISAFHPYENNNKSSSVVFITFFSLNQFWDDILSLREPNQVVLEIFIRELNGSKNGCF